MGYNLPKKYLSASQVTKYLSCPQQYYREYVLDQRPEVPRSSALSVGSAVHKLVENKLSGLLEGSDPTTEELFNSSELDTFFANTDLEDREPEHWTGYTQLLYKTWYKLTCGQVSTYPCNDADHGKSAIKFFGN